MWGLADLCAACLAAVVRVGLNGVYVLGYGLALRALLFIKLMMALTTRLDSLFKGLLWSLIMNHTLYMVALLLLYLLCPSLLRFLFRLRDYLTLLLLEGLRALLTPWFGEIPPLFYSAVRLTINLLTGATWLDLLFQHALSDAAN